MAFTIHLPHCRLVLEQISGPLWRIRARTSQGAIEFTNVYASVERAKEDGLQMLSMISSSEPLPPPAKLTWVET